MSGFRSVVAWALAFMAMASFPSAVMSTPVDTTSLSGTLDPRAGAWQARHRMTSSSYKSISSDMSKNGYKISYITACNIGNVRNWAAVWDKPGSSTAFASVSVASKDYQSQFDNYVRQGYRPLLVTPSTDSTGAVWFDSIWDKSSSPGWIARHDLTSSLYQTAFNDYYKQGYRLKRVNGYVSGGQLRYAGIWEKSASNVKWLARHGMSSAEYQKYTTQYSGEGYRTVHVSVYVLNNVDYYAAIWDKSTGPWLARHALTSDGYQAEVNKWVAQGYRVKTVSAYTLNNQDRYAAIFTKE